jgi:hypothetical protein
MNIWVVAIIIAVISIIMAFISLRSLENKSHIADAKKKLLKGRIVFQDSSSKR